MKTKTESGLEKVLYPEGRSIFNQLTDWYFKPKSFEKSGKLYEKLGVKPFKKLVIDTVGKCLKSRYGENIPTYFIGKKKDINSLSFFEGMTRFNESCHLPFNLIFTDYLARDIAYKDTGAILFDTGFLILNTSLMAVQRYNRARVYNILEKKVARENKK